MEATGRLTARLTAALQRDASGLLAPLTTPLPYTLTPRRLPSLEPVPLDPPPSGAPRRAVVTALLIPPAATGSCAPNGGGDSVDPHALECQVLLIERAAHGTHGGQVALPGGEVEGSETPMETAIRELREELGIDARDPEHHIQFVGGLDPAFVPASGFMVEVLVAITPTSPLLKPDEREVAATLGAALGLFDPRQPLPEIDAVERGVPLRYGYIPVPGERRVWGLTARLLCELAARCTEI